MDPYFSRDKNIIISIYTTRNILQVAIRKIKIIKTGYAAAIIDPFFRCDLDCGTASDGGLVLGSFSIF